MSVVPRNDERWHVGEIENGEFEIEMPQGEVQVQHDHVAFRLWAISPDVVRLMHAIAKGAELAIVNEIGGPHILLVDERHLDLLPAELRRERPVVCASPGELHEILSPQFELPPDEKREMLRRRDLLYSQWTREHSVRSIGSGDPEPNLPGLGGWRDWCPIYIEATRNEGPLLLLRRFGRYQRALIKAARSLPQRGGIHGSSWQFRLPHGEIFTCWRIAGARGGHSDIAGRDPAMRQWLQVVNDFAAATGRRTATIEADRFFLSDGHSYEIHECESRRARDDDD
jgi:hypothetical protein